MPVVALAPTSHRLYRRFVRASIICTMTLGATFGAYNLVWIHWALGPVPPAHNAVHASFQLLGFVQLFVMGVAYQVIPRFLGGQLALQRLAGATFFMILGGLLLRGYGQMGGLLPATSNILLVGATWQLFGSGSFALVLVETWRRTAPHPAIGPFQLGIASGLLGWFAASLLLLAGGIGAWREGDVAASVAWNEPSYLAALLGGTVAFIQGVTLRTAPMFLGVGASRGALAVAAMALGQVGAALATTGTALRGRYEWAAPLIDLGMLAAGGGFALFVFAARVLTRRVSGEDPDDPVPARGARTAFVAGLLFAILAILYGAMDLAGRIPSSALYDGARHALGLGLVTMLILSMGRRMLPVFEGVPLRGGAFASAGIILVGLGLLMRELQVVAFLIHQPGLLRVSGLSGLVAATGVCLTGGALLATLRGKGLRVDRT